MHLILIFIINFLFLSQHICGPRVSQDAFHSMGKFVFYLFDEKYDFYKLLKAATYFCFIFKGKNNIRNKTLSMTPYLEKTVCEKPNLGSGVNLLIRKVR